MTKPFIKCLLVLLCASSGLVGANPHDGPLSLKPDDTPSTLDDQEDLASEDAASIEHEKTTTLIGENINFLDDVENKNGSFWEGTPRKILDRFLPQVTISHDLPTLNNLIEKIILKGEFPQEGGSLPGSLTLKRAQLLMDLGYGEEAFRVLSEDLTSEITSLQNKAAYEQLQFLGLLSARDTEKACTFATSKGYSAEDIFWLKAKIICQNLQGEDEKARIHLEALQEAAPDTSLWESLSSGEINSLEDIDVIIVSLFGENPIKTLSSLSPWLQKWIEEANTVKKNPKKEMLSELENERQINSNPRAQIENFIQDATSLQNANLTYFLQRLAKIYNVNVPHLGVEVPPPSWRQDLGISKKNIDLLMAAAQAKRKGEVILLSVIILKDLKKIHPEVVIKVLLAIKAVGYDEASDALAFELLKLYVN